MGGFKFIEHTGDLGVEVSGQSLSDLFSHAAQALFHILTDRSQIRTGVSRRISVEADGLEGLLVTWLNEFIFLFDTERLLFRDFNIRCLDNHRIEAVADGEPYAEGRHAIKTTVKGATYHRLQVTQEKGVWKCQIIFDL